MEYRWLLPPLPTSFSSLILIPTLYDIHAVWLLSPTRHICLVASVTAVLLWLKIPTFPTFVSLPRCTLASSATSVQTQEIGCSDLLTACFASQVQCSCCTPESVVILDEQKMQKVIDKSNKRTLRGPHTSFTTLPKPSRTRHGYSPIQPTC